MIPNQILFFPSLYNYKNKEYIAIQLEKRYQVNLITWVDITKYNPWCSMRKYYNTKIYIFYSCVDRTDFTRVFNFLKSLNPNKIKNAI